VKIGPVDPEIIYVQNLFLKQEGLNANDPLKFRGYWTLYYNPFRNAMKTNKDE